MKSENEFNSKEEYKKYLKVYFAGLAMQGLLSKGDDIIHNSKDTAIYAKDFADELLKALEEQ